MASPKASGAQMSAEQANMINRNILRRSAPKYNKRLGTFSGSLGQTTRIKLFNVGLITRLVGIITMNLTIGTAVASIGPKGPHAAISRVKLTDFDGSDRINANGTQLFQRNSLRGKKAGLFGMANTVSVTSIGGGVAGLTAALTNPNFPTAVGTADATFVVEIPVAYDVDGGDLRGMILAQTTVGELYCSIDWASALYGNANDDYVYNGAATTTVAANSISVEMYQEYYLPQQVNGVLPIPQIDIVTVYELNGNTRSSDNLATGQNKMLSLPNNRQVVGVYASYLNNGVLGGSAGNDIQYFSIVANGNNIIREYGTIAMYYEQRRKVGACMSKGMYFFDLEDSPVATYLYGNVQAIFQPGGTVTAGASIEIMYESFYVKGAALSGISQSG